LYYALKASPVNKELNDVVFDLRDGPVRFDTESFILSNRPNTPILSISTVRRCSNVFSINGPCLFEGDTIIESKYGNKLKIFYNRGFFAKHGENIYNLDNIEGMIFVKSEVPEYPIISKLLYCYSSLKFHLFDIIGVDNDNILLNKMNDIIIPINEIQQYACIKDSKGSKAFFGNKVLLSDKSEGYLKLVNGKISIIQEDNITDATIRKGWAII